MRAVASGIGAKEQWSSCSSEAVPLELQRQSPCEEVFAELLRGATRRCSSGSSVSVFCLSGGTRFWCTFGNSWSVTDSVKSRCFYFVSISLYGDTSQFSKDATSACMRAWMYVWMPACMRAWVRTLGGSLYFFQCLAVAPYEQETDASSRRLAPRRGSRGHKVRFPEPS